ncbi:MAG: hypothetical protein TREMPRED_003669 [Tremellales sp. Tagirdzhanova-0007]|nr:MAG: hypothetical protein TREMPRED_003669 [Tremellales sp. Tagirdzhanova-0007]
MSESSFKLEDVFSVVGKVVVITGGGTGIAIAQGFVTNGAKVYITGRRSQVLETAAKEISKTVGDVATKAGVSRIVEEITAEESVVDALVNCAGVSAPWRHQIKDHNDPDEVEKLLWNGVEDEDFNYTNSSTFGLTYWFRVYFMTAALVPYLRKSDNPSVVNISSLAGIANQRIIGSVSYGTSKAGTIHLGELLAGRLHPVKIRVNTVCPGIFPSEMTGTSGGSGSIKLGKSAEKAALRSTMQRPGKPEEIFAPVLLLCSKGGMYMNNTVFTVDGGRSLVIVITGGGTGIGRMLAEGFVQNGAKVYIIGRWRDVLDKTVMEVQQEFKGSGGSIFSAPGDISTKEGVRLIVDLIKAKETHVDVLVNNAAVQRAWKNPITAHNDRKNAADEVERLVWEGVDDEDWNITNSINVNGVYFMTAALVPLLRKAEMPSVVVISSVAAVANQRPISTLTYGVSKVAPLLEKERIEITSDIAVHLATMLAGRLAPLKIRVNTILPGTFPTDITARPDGKGGLQLVEGAHKASLRSPIGRAGFRQEIFGPVLLLASQAGGYMDNAMIAVDGGRNMNAGTDDGVRLPDDRYH